MITQDLLNWITPLLYPPELDILKYHTKHTIQGIRIKNWNGVLKKYNLSHHQLKKTIARFRALILIYELEVAAFNL